MDTLSPDLKHSDREGICDNNLLIPFARQHEHVSGGTDQSVFNSEEAKPTKTNDGNKMSAVQSATGTVKVTDTTRDGPVMVSSLASFLYTVIVRIIPVHFLE